jgi:hypothetical protein
MVFTDYYIQQWSSPLFKYVGRQWSHGAKASIFLLLILGPIVSLLLSLIIDICRPLPTEKKR